MSLRPLLSPSRAPPRRRPARGAGRVRVRLAVAAAVPDRGASPTATRAGPTVVVAGDDRSARDLAADLRAWLRPRAGALLPEPRRRLRVAPHAAARTSSACGSPRSTRCSIAAPGDEAPVVVVSAVALSEKVPDPALRPHGFTLRVGELLDLDETADRPRRRGLRARRPGRRPRPVRRPRRPARRLSRRRRSARSASTCSTTRSSRCAGSPRSRSARWATPSASRSRPPPSSRPSTASWPRSPRSRTPDERPDVAELLPVDHFRELLDLLPGRGATS